MAKSKADEWLEQDKLTLLEGWARNGLTDEQIAHNMGIVTSTFYEWKKKYPKFSEVLKKNKEVVDLEVENALLKSALSGNITAQIFWLKNRRKQQWRDKIEYETNTDELNKVKELLSKISEGVNDG
jgi:transposase-like protein